MQEYGNSGHRDLNSLAFLWGSHMPDISPVVYTFLSISTCLPAAHNHSLTNQTFSPPLRITNMITYGTCTAFLTYVRYNLNICITPLLLGVIYTLGRRHVYTPCVGMDIFVLIISRSQSTLLRVFEHCCNMDTKEKWEGNISSNAV